MITFEILFLFLFAHALGDFAFQSEAMAYGKNRHNPPKNVPTNQSPQPLWFYYLGSHALTNGAIFYLLTGNIILGVLESILHFIIDFRKCEGLISLHEDQFQHALCWVLYVVIFYG